MENLKLLSDSELIDLLKQSNETAFNEIFNRHKSYLLKYATRKTKDEELSKDIIHDVFADLWSKRDLLTINCELIMYITLMVKNRIINNYRHAKIKQKHHSIIQSNQSLISNTDHLIRHNELSNKINKAIDELPSKIRMVFELSRKQNMNRKQISDHLNMPENTVKTNLQRALGMLRVKLHYN